MKNPGTLIGIAILLALSGDAQQCLQHPKRLINGSTVNLAPLFAWYSQYGVASATGTGRSTTNTPSRPLSAWVRVISTQAQDSAMGWIVVARTEDQPRQLTERKILLRHPPTSMFPDGRPPLPISEEQRKLLLARLDELQREFQVLAPLAEDNRNRAMELSDHAQINSGFASGDRYAAASGSAYRSYEAVSAKLSRNSAEVQAIQKRLESYRYSLDVLALRTGETYNGLPVYDMGMVVGD